MKRIAIAIGLLCAAGAGAQQINGWRTPSGTLYFGDRPPQGSVPAMKVEKPIGKVSAPDLPPSERDRTQRYAWRDGVECRDLKFMDVKDEPFEGVNRRIMRGTVTHDGNHIVKNAEVCAGTVCDDLRGGEPLARGEHEDFYLDVPSGERVPLRIECSVREPV